jgi:hypothetical protein
MSSVTATSTGISDLLQIFSSAATPAISSLLSSSQVQAALEKAPPADIVELSDEAMQLQQVDGLFGGSTSSQPASSGLGMQDLLASLFNPSGSASGSQVNLLA